MEAIKGRRSVRSFLGQPVDRKILEQLVEAAIWAPSGGNAQTWHFVVVTNSEQLSRLRTVSPGMLGVPPATIVVCQDQKEAKRKGGPLGAFLAVVDAAMAAQNILLAAYDAGLGTCVIASFHTDAVARILGLPEEMKPVLLISVGWPERIPSPPPRRTDVISWERYGKQV